MMDYANGWRGARIMKRADRRRVPARIVAASLGKAQLRTQDQSWW
jgi:hypothetical protein